MEQYLNKTLTELENDDWREPACESYLVTTCHELRYKPIGEFEIEDLRIMIGQDSGMKYLLPLAISRLEKNIFSEGDYYKGDLFCAVIRSASGFLNHNQDLKEKVRSLINRAEEEKIILDEIDRETFDEAFCEALNEFNKYKNKI